VENADWDTLRLLLPRIEGPPGDAKQAMYDAIALLEDRWGPGVTRAGLGVGWGGVGWDGICGWGTGMLPRKGPWLMPKWIVQWGAGGTARNGSAPGNWRADRLERRVVGALAEARSAATRSLASRAHPQTWPLCMPRCPGWRPRSVVARAEDVAADFLESVRNIDSPRKYFDAMPSRVVSGAQNAEFVKFASGALTRSRSKLAEFLSLMPRGALAAARQTVKADEDSAAAEAD
jgi:hypothetical protein